MSPAITFHDRVFTCRPNSCFLVGRYGRLQRRFASLGTRLFQHYCQSTLEYPEVHRPKISISFARDRSLRPRRVRRVFRSFFSKKKSIGEASQRIEYLGLIADSVSLALSLLDEKVLCIIRLCETALKSSQICLRDIAKLLGNFTWAIQAIPFAQAHYRALQRIFILESEKNPGNLQIKVELDGAAKNNLLWWVENVAKANGKPMSAVEPDLIIYCDACLSGLGAALNGSTARGLWTSQDATRHKRIGTACGLSCPRILC